MTNAFASKMIRSAGTAVLACILASSAGAENSEPKTMVLFFDMQSSDLTPEAKSIVLSAVDVAERGHARQIELAAFSSSDEFARDPALAARRAAAVKDLIADYGFAGLVVVDEEGPQLPLVRVGGDTTFDRVAALQLDH